MIALRLRVRRGGTAIAVLLLAANAHAQRSDDTYTVNGSMVRYTRNSITVETDTGERTLRVGRDSEVRVRAPVTEDFFVRGTTVEVHGNVTPDLAIEDAYVIVFLGRSRPVNSSSGAYFSLEAKKGEPIPAVIIGTIVQGEPLRIKGANSITSRYYFSDEVDADGVPINWHEVPSIGKLFNVKTRATNIGFVDLGNAIQHAGEKPLVTAFVDKRTDNARTLFVQRLDPLDLEQLGIKPKKAKKPRRLKKDRKKTG